MSLDIFITRNELIQQTDLLNAINIIKGKYPEIRFEKDFNPPPPIILVYGDQSKIDGFYEVFFWGIPKMGLYLSYDDEGDYQSMIVITSNSNLYDYMQFIAVEIAKLLNCTAFFLDDEENIEIDNYNSDLHYKRFYELHVIGEKTPNDY